jgi:transposase InsO family protein
MNTTKTLTSGQSRPVFSAEEKQSIIAHAETHGTDKAVEAFGVSRSSIYNWRRRLAKGGPDALIDKRSQNRGGGRKVPDWKRTKVLAIKESDPGFGPSQIRNQLRREGITISILSIRKILKEAGYDVGTRHVPKKEYTRFEASRPLELAQIDICEFYLHKLKVYLVILLDDFSRFILNFALLDACKMDAIQETVDKAIRRYGKMERLLSDRGFVFHGWRGINAFERWLEELDIYHIHTSPHHPQTIGKVEAVNKSVQKELIRVREFSGIGDATEAIGQWVWRYNYHRVHQGLDGLCVPADRFHGWLEEVERSMSKMVEDGIKLAERDIRLFTIRLTNGQLQLTILGRQVYLGENPSQA